MIKTLPLILSLFLNLQELVNGCPNQIVYVVNTLPVSSESPLMKVHCNFSGQDLGVHVLYHDQDFHWNFCDSSKGKIMTCQLVWGSKKVAFEAFKESGVYISESFWSARSDGIYLRDSVGNEKQVKWMG